MVVPWIVAVIFAVMIYVGTYNRNLVVAYGAMVGFVITCTSIFLKLMRR